MPLQLNLYRFNPKSDITAYELALLMDFIVPRINLNNNRLLDIIETRWDNSIFDHIDKASDETPTDFFTHVQNCLAERNKK